MLIVVSDLHLGDGTCGRSISATAFQLFADRLKELAFNASWRAEGTYRPLERIEILLLGDILDPLHSTLWLDKETGTSHDIRPWTDINSPKFAGLLTEITQAILIHNSGSIGIMRSISNDEIISIPPTNRNGKPALDTNERIQVPVQIYYMIGNHDWYYHIPGRLFDTIRKNIVTSLGLSNSSKPFPYDASESDDIQALFNKYNVFARHGDSYDGFNFNKEKGRNAASLGDVFAIEMLNRFPVELKRRMGNDLPESFTTSLRELVNVRPVLATPLWISAQLRQNNVAQSEQKRIKEIWDQLGEEFLAIDYVRQADRDFKLDIVDGLELLMRLTKRVSFKTIDDVVVWIRQKLWSENVSFAHNAFKEEAFLKRTAQFIVYGHIHRYEIIPLDTIPTVPRPTNQMYFNSGTWHTYYDLAMYKPEEQKFIPYQVLTYLSFYRDDERAGRRFETWSGAYSD